ncbi:unnamed protein product [Dovyalis caffra]|uniref:Maturase K n=1 Tax=Dovyalis caffra TaxID=77055 RepID=A0AAV1QPR4_9ROSI|nr:unnamed protein product [Dovyalis caffra]
MFQGEALEKLALFQWIVRTRMTKRKKEAWDYFTKYDSEYVFSDFSLLASLESNGFVLAKKLGIKWSQMWTTNSYFACDKHHLFPSILYWDAKRYLLLNNLPNHSRAQMLCLYLDNKFRTVRYFPVFGERECMALCVNRYHLQLRIFFLLDLSRYSKLKDPD